MLASGDGTHEATCASQRVRERGQDEGQGEKDESEAAAEGWRRSKRRRGGGGGVRRRGRVEGPAHTHFACTHARTHECIHTYIIHMDACKQSCSLLECYHREREREREDGEVEGGRAGGGRERGETERPREREGGGGGEKESERERPKERDRETERQRDRETERPERQRDRETERQRHKDRERERREGERHTRKFRRTEQTQRLHPLPVVAGTCPRNTMDTHMWMSVCTRRCAQMCSMRVLALQGGMCANEE